MARAEVSPKTIEKLQQRLDAIFVAITGAVESVRQNKPITPQQLNVLNKETTDLCRDLQFLPAEQATPFSPRMAELIGTLETLADELEHFKDRMLHGRG